MEVSLKIKSIGNIEVMANFSICVMIIMYQIDAFIPRTIANILKIALPFLALFVSLTRNKYKIINWNVILWISGFIFMSVVSMLSTVDFYESIDRLISLFSLFVILSALSQYTRREENMWKVIYYSITGALIFTILNVLNNMGKIISLNFASLDFDMSVNNVITPTVYYLIWSIFYKKDKRPKTIITAMILLFLSFISGLKKATFFPFIFLSILLMLMNRKKVLKNLTSIMFITIVCFSVYQFVMNNELFYEIIGRRIEGFTNYFTGDGRVDGSTRVRMGLMDEAWHVFLDNPITGVGLGAFRSVTTYQTYAHNNFLELLACTGILGFVSFYWVHFYLVIKLFKKIKFKQYESNSILFLAAILTNLLHDIATISYYRINYILPVCLALCYLNIQKRNIRL